MNKRGESSKSGLFSQLMNSDLSVFTCPPLREERLGLKTKNCSESEAELCLSCVSGSFVKTNYFPQRCFLLSFYLCSLPISPLHLSICSSFLSTSFPFSEAAEQMADIVIYLLWHRLKEKAQSTRCTHCGNQASPSFNTN